MNWYAKLTQNLAILPDFISHYEKELEDARHEVSVKGNIEKNLAALPGITDYRFQQLQLIEAVLNYLNLELKKTKSKFFKKYLEGYQRALTSRDAEKYVDGETEVINMELLIGEVSLLRNRYLGIMKGLESKNFMLGHIVRLRVSGMEDAAI
jgi:hypothetical protein